MQRYNDWTNFQHARCPTWSPPEGNGVYLFVKFPEVATEFVAQTVVLSKRSALISHGHFIGIARKVHDLSSGPKRPEALVVYLFESTERAKRFFISDNRFKQPDFPAPSGICEAWTVVKFLRTRDDNDYTTYMMCETSLKYASYSSYKTRFVQPLAGLILEYGGQPFVVQSMGVEAIRRHYTGDNVISTLHLFRNQSDVKAMMDDDRFQLLRRIQDEFAHDCTSVFTIDPEACP